MENHKSRNAVDEKSLCLLSLDGGGVRGLSTLLILRGLMDRTNKARAEGGLPSVKPCELFDLIGGTSTGGLIAIMLGHLKMDVEECIEAYSGMFRSIFEKKHSIPLTFTGKVRGRFDSDILQKAITQIVENRGFPSTELFNTEVDRSCRVFVCATSYENKDIIHIRDYSLVDEANHDQATIVEAALATSFFEPVKIGARTYVDGALGVNNPVDSIWKEAQNICSPDDGNIDPMIKCIVSIGTGIPGLEAIKDGIKGFLVRTLKRVATETE